MIHFTIQYHFVCRNIWILNFVAVQQVVCCYVFLVSIAEMAEMQSNLAKSQNLVTQGKNPKTVRAKHDWS